ncbi:phosphonate C-P lyase system protein PhnG [Bordetella petrii]|uniref:phosphonate C-P lyase system protein PhnG n=1 Tax=Bordetella petrii TaxID=94624 RepID=UPI001A969DC4|nr:phosphonate C-P lyase system protein PhnG [Bordetella petrii]MBO1113389.1 phosphonate C-P lyase system protein PhnG [Bordetella petrii]
MQTDTTSPAAGRRAAWMRVLALAEPAALDRAVQALGPLPPHSTLRPAESGMAMVRARSGGTGAQFNLGEMSITRCAVTLEGGTMGVGYVPGRARRHAEHAAVLDALLQRDEWHDRIQAGVIEPLAQAHAERARRQSCVAAQTQVEFFTMVRGED